jgi:ferredoxin
MLRLGSGSQAEPPATVQVRDQACVGCAAVVFRLLCVLYAWCWKVALGMTCIAVFRSGASISACPLQHSTHIALTTPSIPSAYRM